MKECSRIILLFFQIPPIQYIARIKGAIIIKLIRFQFSSVIILVSAQWGARKTNKFIELWWRARCEPIKNHPIENYCKYFIEWMANVTGSCNSNSIYLLSESICIGDHANWPDATLIVDRNITSKKNTNNSHVTFKNISKSFDFWFIPFTAVCFDYVSQFTCGCSWIVAT